MNAQLKIKPIVQDKSDSDRIWTKAVFANKTVAEHEQFGIANMVATMIEALEDIQVERIESEGNDYYETEHYRNTQHAIEVATMINSAFDLDFENDNKTARRDKLNQIIHNLTVYRVREFATQHPHIHSPAPSLQEVLNIIRNWVFDRSGKSFSINDILNCPELSEKLHPDIKTMVVIDRALITLRCTINREVPGIPFSDMQYTPPAVRRINRDDLYS